MNSWRQIKDKPCGFLTAQKGGAAGRRPSCLANSRLKQIEKEYTQKLSKSSQIIAELQTTISSLKEESSRQQLAAERRLQDVVQKFEDEKQQLIRDNDQAI
ncbi:hypothetical protein U0070_002002, partial [Myodes glareolus]